MRLQPSWAVATAAGEPHATIRVRNLQASVKVGTDAWGRGGKVQPVLISATVSLRAPFETASSEDTVNKSTIHYGILSKAILAAVEDFHRNGAALSIGGESRLKNLGDHISGHLTSETFAGRGNINPLRVESDGPVLDTGAIRSLELRILLPKASLIGSGVSLFGTRLFTHGQYSLGLALHDIRIPTLIGVNPNERLAKQIVMASVEIDQWTEGCDLYSNLEELVVKTIEESSFQTLEALATHVALRTVEYFIIPIVSRQHPGLAINAGWTPENDEESVHYPRVKITLEKPTAVTFADAPMVEMLLDSNPFAPNCNKAVGTMWMKPDHPELLPFPLQCRLDEWIRKT